VFLIIAVAVFAEKSPMTGWTYTSFPEFHGRRFYRVGESYNEKDGYAIVNGRKIHYDYIREYNPNPNLASSVKALMTQRGCNVSVALITDNPGYDYVVINEYSENQGIYWTTIYPLQK
jgi:hypothetical protein